MPTVARFKSTLADVLEIPKDVVLNLPRIVMVGNIQLQVENHRGLTAYDGSNIRVDLARGEIHITGDHLTIRTVDRDLIIVDGQITAVEFKE